MVSNGTDTGRIEHVVVVGGGTAGWLAATYLTRMFGKRTTEQLRITLVESKDIGTIGVGEATIPTLRNTLGRLGIDERDFMRKCNATLKLAIKFENWHDSPADNPNDVFWHPFGSVPLINNVGVADYWLKNRDKVPTRFADCFSVHPGLAQRLKSPKGPKADKFAGQAVYAYHIDATLFGHYLRDIAKERGVNHIVDTVVDVALDERGHIDHLKLKENDHLKGDLYLDCSGFVSLLLEKTMKEPFISYEDGLLCNRAIAIGMPWDEESPSKLNSYTTATALENGWSWDIPLYTRRGRGYVYSGSHATEDEAETEFRRVIGDEDGKYPARHLKMRVGRSRRLWVNNCISLGLSGGFIEPLESTAIYLVEMGLNLLTLNFPDKSFPEPQCQRYNTQMTDLYDHTRDFIVYHYCITNREDTAFWRHNKHDLAIPDELAFLMEMWKKKVPARYDFTATIPLFGHISYIFIMAGHGAWPEDGCANFDFLDDGAAVRTFRRNQQKLNQLSRKLPDHARYIRWVQTEQHQVVQGDADPEIGPAHDLSDPLGREVR